MEVNTLLILWTDKEDGPRAEALARSLRGAALQVELADLRQMMGSLSVAQSVAAWASEELEASVLASVVGQRFGETLERRRPRLVLALDPVGAAAAGIWRKKGMLPAPIVGLVDGLFFDPRWAGDAVDRLLIVDEGQRTEARSAGIVEALLVSVALDAPPAPSSGRPELRQRVGLRAAATVVLLDTSGFDLGELGDAMFQLSLLGDDATLLIDAPNREVADLLRNRAEIYGVHAAMFGATDERDVLWACADVAIARPSSDLEGRAAAFGLGIVAYLAEGPTEEGRARAYLARGIGVIASTPSLLAAAIDRVLAADAEVRQTSLEALRQGQPKAEAIARLCDEADAILAERLASDAAQRSRPASGASSAPSEPASPSAGPLEFIGGRRGASISGRDRRAAVEADLRRLEAEEELRRLKREQRGERALRDFEGADESSGDPSTRSSAAAPAAAEREETIPAVGLDPGFKRRAAQKKREVEDELQALKRKMRET